MMPDLPAMCNQVIGRIINLPNHMIRMMVNTLKDVKMSMMKIGHLFSLNPMQINQYTLDLEHMEKKILYMTCQRNYFSFMEIWKQLVTGQVSRYSDQCDNIGYDT